MVCSRASTITQILAIALAIFHINNKVSSTWYFSLKGRIFKAILNMFKVMFKMLKKPNEVNPENVL